jgi:hypothetical protein
MSELESHVLLLFHRRGNTVKHRQKLAVLPRLNMADTEYERRDIRAPTTTPPFHSHKAIVGRFKVKMLIGLCGGNIAFFYC